MLSLPFIAQVEHSSFFCLPLGGEKQTLRANCWFCCLSVLSRPLLLLVIYSSFRGCEDIYRSSIQRQQIHSHNQSCSWSSLHRFGEDHTFRAECSVILSPLNIWKPICFPAAYPGSFSKSLCLDIDQVKCHREILLSQSNSCLQLPVRPSQCTRYTVPRHLNKPSLYSFIALHSQSQKFPLVLTTPSYHARKVTGSIPLKHASWRNMEWGRYCLGLLRTLYFHLKTKSCLSAIRWFAELFKATQMNCWAA